MPASHLSDLLPIPPGVTDPHAYQVFGLDGGEQDGDKISAAMKSVYGHLKSAKSDSDPLVWKSAAKLAESARRTLQDPAARAELDARFGIVAVSETAVPETTSNSSNQPSPTDPLAAMLPASDPLAGILPSANPLTPPDPSHAAPPLGFAPPAPEKVAPGGTAPQPATPPASAAAQPTAAIPKSTAPVGTTGASEVNLRGAKRGRKRKKGVGMFVFGSVLLLLFAMIGGLLYVLMVGPDQFAFLRSEEERPESGIRVNPPAPNPRPPAADGVMGEVAASGLATTFTGRDSAQAGSGLNDPAMNGPAMNGGGTANAPAMNPGGGPMMSESDTTPPATTPPATPQPVNPTPTPPVPEPAAPEPSVPEPSVPEPPMATPGTPDPAMTPVPELTPEAIDANEIEMAKVGLLIRNRDWASMKPEADKLIERELNESQSLQADSLYHIADLATFYRGAIVKGLATLETGSTFQLTSDFPVIVVEHTSDSLTIRYNRKEKTFTIDEMPFSVANRLASFALSIDQPDGQAAQVIYQSVAAKSTPEHREDAIEVLSGLEGQLETVDVPALIEMLRVLYPK